MSKKTDAERNKLTPGTVEWAIAETESRARGREAGQVREWDQVAGRVFLDDALPRLRPGSRLLRPGGFALGVHGDPGITRVMGGI